MSAQHLVELVVAGLLLLGAGASRRDRRPRRWYRSESVERGRRR